MPASKVTYYGRAFLGEDYANYIMVRLGDYAATPRGTTHAINKLTEMIPNAQMYEVECSKEFSEAYDNFISSLW
jgi:hypothetical protein